LVKERKGAGFDPPGERQLRRPERGGFRSGEMIEKKNGPCKGETIV
jgi:hypothetical protein